MQIIKSENGDVWVIKEGFIIPEDKQDIDVEESVQKAYLLDVLGNFTAENDKVLNKLISTDATRRHTSEVILSDGHDVYIQRDVETIECWRKKFASDTPAMDIIEQTTDIEELKTLLRAVSNMGGYNLLKVGFIEQITEAIISQTKKQLRNAEG